MNPIQCNGKFIFTIIIAIILQISGHAANYERDYFNILAQYRPDIPSEVIKNVKRDMGYFDDKYPRIHDSWIEHPFGKSVDLQGNEMFPDVDYQNCKQLSPSHFELSNFKNRISYKGVVRTDGTIIVPIENIDLEYYPLYNVIIAKLDWYEYGYSVPKKGKVKIYNYYGDLLYTFDGVSKIIPLWGIQEGMEITTDHGVQRITFSHHHTDREQDNLIKFFTEGPQACTYNIIRYLCASNKKGEQKKAMDLLDYFMMYILPGDTFSLSYSSVGWDATLRYLACLNFTKDYSRIDVTQGRLRHANYHFICPANGNNGMLKGIKHVLPEAEEMAIQAERMLNEASGGLYNKQMAAEQRRQTWLTILGVLSSAISSGGVYESSSSTAATGGNVNLGMSSAGKSMLEQTHISDELMGAAIVAGYVPESPSLSSSNTPSHQESHKNSSTSNGRICHACFGSGVHQVCNGSGTQLAWGNKRIEKCSGCHGTGKCPHCSGQGRHL